MLILDPCHGISKSKMEMKSEESPGNRLRGEGGEERERECVSERREGWGMERER